MTPVDRRQERLLPSEVASASARQEAEPVVEPGDDLSDAQRPDQAAAISIANGIRSSRLVSVGDLGEFLFAVFELRLVTSRPFDEELDRFERLRRYRCPKRSWSTSTRRITSPPTPIGSRAVTRIVSPGQAESHFSVSSAQVGIRCSQLSRITRGLPATGNRSGPSRPTRPGSPEPPSRSPQPRERAPDRKPAQGRRTRSRPVGTGRDAEAASIARRVFPQPPGPVNVTSRAVSKSSASSATSRSRPTKLEIAFGRLCRAPGAVRGAGKSPRRSG